MQLRFLEVQVKTEDIQDARGRLYDVADPATMAFQVLDVRACGKRPPRLTRSSQHHLEKLETEQIQMRNNIEALERNLNEASELRLVLQTLENFIRPPQRRGGAPSPAVSDIELGAAGAVGCGTLTAFITVGSTLRGDHFRGLLLSARSFSSSTPHSRFPPHSLGSAWWRVS